MMTAVEDYDYNMVINVINFQLLQFTIISFTLGPTNGQLL